MKIPSHELLMAAVNTLQLIELRDGYKACRQASELLDALFAQQLPALNVEAASLTRNEMQHILRMLLRRDARNAGVLLPSLQC